MTIDTTGRAHKPAGSPASTGGQFAAQQAPAAAAALRPEPQEYNAIAFVLLLEDARNGNFANRDNDLYYEVEEALWAGMDAEERAEYVALVPDRMEPVAYAQLVSTVDDKLAHRLGNIDEKTGLIIVHDVATGTDGGAVAERTLVTRRNDYPYAVGVYDFDVVQQDDSWSVATSFQVRGRNTPEGEDTYVSKYKETEFTVAEDFADEDAAWEHACKLADEVDWDVDITALLPDPEETR